MDRTRLALSSVFDTLEQVDVTNNIPDSTWANQSVHGISGIRFISTSASTVHLPVIP